MNKPKFPENLKKKCAHYQYGTIQAYTCLHCLKNWAKVVPIDEVRDAVSALLQAGLTIASDRLQQEYKILKQRIDDSKKRRK